MTATVVRPITAPAAATRTHVWRTGALAAGLAAVATEVYTAVIRAAGVHLAIGNIGGTAKDVVKIGPGACTIMVAICVTAGLVLASALNRWAKRPDRTFRVAAVALTALSLAPDILAGATATSSKLVLMTAHVLAATIVIPLVSRRLRTGR